MKKNELLLSTLGHTWIFDLDGTIVKHNGYLIDGKDTLLPGVLSGEESFEEESHFNSLLEYPQYTHPAEWQGREVPEILLSGHHANVEKWRREQSLKRTLERRPDMLDNADLSKEDIEFLSNLKRD